MHISNFRLSPLAIFLGCLFTPLAQAQLHFDPNMLSTDSAGVADLSRFESGEAQSVGDYMVDIYLNGNIVSTRNVHFVDVPADEHQEYIHDKTGLMACLDKKDLSDMGVNIAAFTELAAMKDGQCVSPGNVIPQAFTAFNFQQQRLDVSIPQAALQNKPRGWVSPELWDEGINAALLSYQFSGSENQGSYGNSRSNYLNLSSGLNLGAWRLRDSSTWRNYENRYGSQNRWQHISTYVQRAIIPWRSELTMGQSATNGDVFDSLSFQGLQLGSDDSMYPNTMRGFAPEIKGVANSNAQVSIRQNGNVVYRTFVAPGAFVINDLYPVASGGDLSVTITEADGTIRTFTVPYSSLPVLQRQGHVRYGLTAGRYYSNSDSYSDPAFVQGTMLWGMPHSITVYGGTQLADRYRAVALGTGLNMGDLGAVSADITQADSTLADGSRHQGQSVRFLYGRSLIATGTTFQLVGYRYSTQGFHTLDETALKGMSGWDRYDDEVDAAGHRAKLDWGDYYNLYSSKRERIQANITQRLGDLGSLNLTGSHQTYWHNTTATDSLMVGFGSMLSQVSYNVSYGYSRMSGQQGSDRTLYLSLSMPLDAWLPHDNTHSMRVYYDATHDGDGNLSNRASLSGSALEDNNLSWSVSQGYGREDGDSGDVNLDYRGGYGNASLGYGYSRDYRQLRYGASGGAVLHSGGLTLGQPLGSTNVLIAAPGADNVPVENGSGIHTDWRGYTVVPYASSYQTNRVALDINRLDEHTDIDNPVARVTPTRGALVRADFHTHTGVRTLMSLSRNGTALPFGSTVSTADNRSSGLVGDNGQVWLTGLAQEGVLTAQWGVSSDQQCTVHYHLPESALHTPMIQIKEACH